MIVSDRLVFLHVPKAGGTSIAQYLMDVLRPPVYYSLPGEHDVPVPAGVTRFHGMAHESLEEARVVLARLGRRLEEFPVVIACARNPYELEVSRYAFLRRDLAPYNCGPQQALALLGDFEVFATCSAPHGRRPLEAYFVLEGLVPPNLRIVRLENLEHELVECLAEAGIEADPTAIPHYNRSPHESYRSFYTPSAEQAVYEKYKWVFDAGLYPRLASRGEPRWERFANPEEVDRLVESRLTGLDGRGDSFARANVWLAAAEIHRYRLRATAQADALERALRVGSGEMTPPIVQELARCRSLGGLGTVEEGIATCSAVLDRAGEGWRSGGMRLVLAELLAAAGRFHEARAACEEVQSSSPELTLAAASCAGSVELLAGDAEAAERRFRDGWWNPIGLAADRAEALWRLGRHDEVDRIAGFTEAVAPAHDLRAQARWRRLRAKLLARAGKGERALELARDGVVLTKRCEAPNLQADALVDLAEVLGLLGRDDEALVPLAEALRLYERKGNAASARLAGDLLASARVRSRRPRLPASAS